MGATCSSTALTRYNLIKRKLSSKDCLTFEAADGLLPRVEGTAPPVWLMGEDHGANESDGLPRSKRNCALVLDLVKEAVSGCETNGAEVVFIFENAVISDSEHLFRRDVNEDEVTGDPHHDVRAVRETAKRLGGLYPNVRLVYMDVFGRGRLFLDGSRESLDKIGWFNNDVSYIHRMIWAELKEFWITSGRYQKEEAETRATLLTGQAMMDINLSVLPSKIMNLAGKYQRQPFDIFLTIMCVKVAQNLLSSRSAVGLALKNADSKVIRDLEESVRALFSEDYDIPANLQKAVDDGQVPEEAARSMMLFSENFGLMIAAGDAVLYEFITSLSNSTSSSNSRIVVMHAGYRHVHNQRRWLLGGQYDVDAERISASLVEPEEFTKSRMKPTD
jgi:hypothetical protein